MLVVTTPSLEGKRIQTYLGTVSGESILGANIFRDIMAGLRDLVGGRVAVYEEKLKMAKQAALRELVEEATGRGANAVVGLSLDYEFISMKGVGGMLMVAATGTAVIVEGES
jgi:uncharacterized protein YbjQ (UPF0145 family)